MSFYNTTSETGLQLAEYQQKAGEQNMTVMELFRHYKRPLSPSEVLRLWPSALRLPPLTSVRRAITTMTASGALVRTDQKREGMFGRMEHVWALPEAKNG